MATTFDDYIANNPTGADAWTYLSSLLEQYNLGSLDSFAQGAIVQGLSANEIVQRLRTTDEYKTRFKAITERQAQGLPPISESEVLNYEKQATQMMRSAGLPSGFYDSPDDFVNLQTKDVSLSELQSRINDGFLAAAQAPQDVRDEWSKLGYTEGDLAAYMLDPDRTESVLTKQIGAVQQAAQAQRAGFGQLSREEAEGLQSLGVTSEQAQQGFSDLVNQRQLLTALPGGNESDISRQDQLDAEFANNVAVQQELKKRAASRVATFQSSTQFTNDKEGYSGLGVAR